MPGVVADKVVVELEYHLDEASRRVRQGRRQFSDEMNSIKRDAKSTELAVVAAGRSMGASLGGLLMAGGVVGAVAGATTALVSFGGASLDAAKDVEELESALDATFGTKRANLIRAWAEETGNSLGRATSILQESAMNFEILFSRAASPEKALELSKSFAVLTQDLSSFRNVSAEIVQQNIQSGLVGETEPLRKYGILINDAAVKAKGLQLGIAGAKGEMSEAAKVMARAALITEQTTTAQGDLARTVDSTSNAQRAAKDATLEMSQAFGRFFTPAAAKAAAAWRDVANAITGALNMYMRWRQNTTGVQGEINNLGKTIAARQERIEALRGGNAWDAFKTGTVSGLGAMNPEIRARTADRLEKEQNEAKARWTEAVKKQAAAAEAITPTPEAPASAPTAAGSGGSSKAKGPKGPSAQELADRAELLRLDQEIAVQSARNDDQREQAARDRLETIRQIQAYEDTGMSRAAATVAAERDILELQEARAEGKSKLARLDAEQELLAQREKLEALALYDLENDLQILRATGTAAEIKALERQVELQRLIAQFRGAGHDVKESMAGAEELLSAQEMATMRERFRESFGEGIRAALNGDLGSFFENWVMTRAARGFDAIADTIFSLFSKGAGGGGSGGIIGAIGGIFGKRAAGGRVVPGAAYMVGENGPEPFVPDSPGSIVPNGRALGGAGTTVVQKFNINAQGAIMADGILREISKMGEAATLRGSVGGAQMAQIAVPAEASRRARFRFR